MADFPVATEQTTDTSIELVLKATLARINLELRGLYESGGIKELSGRADIEKSLKEILDALASKFDARGISLLTADSLSNVTLKSFEVAYASAVTRITVSAAIGANIIRVVLFKSANAFVSGLELQLDPAILRNNVLTGLVGEINLGNLGIYYASGDISGVDYDPSRQVPKAGSLVLPSTPSSYRNFTKGINWSANISAGKLRMLEYPQTSAAPPPPAPPAPPAPPPPAPTQPKDSTTWINISKTFGPLTVDRLGLSFESPRIAVKFDAGLQLSALTLTVEGLAISYPLDKFSNLSVKTIYDNLNFDLDGMGLAIGSGPVQIGGSLLRVRGTGRIEFEGSLLVKTAAFNFSAFGSYANLNGTPSVMAYAILLRPMGGPAFFFVTGIAFGFGINRKLRLPAIDQVRDFPLVKAAMGDVGFTDLTKLPRELRDSVTPAIGDYWIAAGIRFNSFVMIQSFILLTVSFGSEIEIGILGLGRLTVPPLVKDPIPPIACAELALRAVIRVSEGSIEVEARLTDNSFIFARSVKLMGGFAFFVWFAGPRAGDFVVSLGGYHPSFNRPAHYPQVPRVGIQWQLNSEIGVTGEAYFALTPSCLMAGGKLSMTFRSGVIEAWFTAFANFLLCWQPFFYRAEMGVSIGVACRVKIIFATISIRVEVSVGLALWGPPFGGEARVDLSVISFAIRFGSGRPQPGPLTANEFVQNCLPPAKTPGDADVFSINVADGLLREQDLDGGGTLRMVSAQKLSLTVQSVVPCTSFAGQLVPPVPQANASALGIKPRGKTGLQSTITVNVVKLAGVVQQPVDSSRFTTSLLKGNVPEAVWGKAPSNGTIALPEKPEARLIETNVGLRVACNSVDPSHALPVIAFETLAYEDVPVKPVIWANTQQAPTRSYPSGTTIFSTIMNPTVAERRNNILSLLANSTPFQFHQPALDKLAAGERDYFQANVRLCPLGASDE